MLQERKESKWESVLHEAEERNKIWPLLRRLRIRREPNVPLQDDQGNFRYKDHEKVEIIADFLEKHFYNQLPEIVDDLPVQQVVEPLGPIIFSQEKVETCCRQLSTKKAAGVDKIPPKVIKCLPTKAFKVLTDVFNSINNGTWYPDQWKTSLIVSISKKEKDPSKLCNRRPISIPPIMSRVYEKLLIPRVNEEIEVTNAILPEQFGFMKTSGVAQQAAHLANIRKSVKTGRRKVIATFIDLEKAYDSVSNKRLLNKMRAAGSSAELRQIIRNINNNRKFKTKVRISFSSERNV